MDSRDLKKKKRRPRSAAGDRNYMCGCGKAYLSYPALYTHVKNKHDGVFPIGSNAKRKIPKNGDEESEQLYIPSVERFYQEFDEFTKQLPEAASSSRSRFQLEDLRKLQAFKLDSDDHEMNSLRTAVQSVLILEASPDKLEAAKENFSIFQILGYYLISIHPYCSDKLFKEYALLIAMIIRALNEKGEMFLDKNDKRKPSQKPEDAQKCFCDSDNINVCAEILNLFIAELFPQYFKKLSPEYQASISFLGFEDDNIKNLILMAKYLANWLFNQEFTEYRLEINVDF